jgi:hypothetical protein
MPLASCQPCVAIYAADIQVCRCEESGVGRCPHWRRHHAEISGLCQSALIGCRLCSELWRYFFKEKTPQEYAEEPWFATGNSVHAFMNSGIWYRAVDVTGQPADRAVGPAAALNDGETDGALTLALCFGISSPMIQEVEERRYFLRKVSGMASPYSPLTPDMP